MTDMPSRHCEPWELAAACRGVNPNVFHPAVTSGRDNEHAYDAARAVCDTCPVKAECLDHALETPEREGVWGGMSPKERQLIIRRRRENRILITERVATVIAERPDTVDGVARRMGLARFTVRGPLRHLLAAGRVVFEQEHHNAPRVYRMVVEQTEMSA